VPMMNLQKRPFRAAREGETARVHRLVKAMILQGQARPGQFLAEVELARLCNTSRTPVREACNRLAQENWLTHIRRKGYLVPPISVREIVDVYEFRKLLEGFAVEKAAAVARPDQVGELRGVLEVERGPRVAVADLLKANRRLHLGLAEIAGNRRMLDQLRLTLEYVDRLDILSREKDSNHVPHDEIVHAVAARNARAARRAMAEHIDLARDRMLKLFGT
jgi:GntR family transcriptional regulator, rspAB operon transcriptional repressor